MTGIIRKKQETGNSACAAFLRSGWVWKTDLHMHTTASDGTDTPEELLVRVKKAGIPLFSITDHDTVKGCRIMRSSLGEGDPRFITGVEFSCKDDEGSYHILGYGADPDAPSILRLVETGHDYRIRKLRARLEHLEKEYRISFPDEAVRMLYEMENPGKPHLGNLMVELGYAPTKELAIREYLDGLHFYEQYLDPAEAITGILSSGGIPVLAHPSAGKGDEVITGDDLEKRLKKLMSCGLGGVEAYYSGFAASQIGEILSFAGKYDLYVTAGSDYHGTNKKVALGNTGMNSQTELPDGFIRFLKKVMV